MLPLPLAWLGLAWIAVSTNLSKFVPPGWFIDLMHTYLHNTQPIFHLCISQARPNLPLEFLSFPFVNEIRARGEEKIAKGFSPSPPTFRLLTGTWAICMPAVSGILLHILAPSADDLKMLAPSSAFIFNFSLFSLLYLNEAKNNHLKGNIDGRALYNQLIFE